MNHHNITSARALWNQGQASRPTTSPTTLPLADIHPLPEVFQPRTDSSQFEQDDHVRDLVRAISLHGQPLEPLTVIWLQDKYVIVDGHHRYLAYVASKLSYPDMMSSVPVTEHQGSFDEAVKYSIEVNRKAKLVMTKEERIESAWQLYLAGAEFYGSYRKLAALTGVGLGQPTAFKDGVEAMKKLELPYEAYTWKEVLSAKRGIVTYDEDWKEREAKDWARRLLKTFGSQMKKHPDVFADALMERLGESAFKVLAQQMQWHLIDEDELGF